MKVKQYTAVLRFEALKTTCLNVSYNVLMFQPYDGNCDVFYIRKYDFSEPLPCSELFQIVKTKYNIAA